LALCKKTIRVVVFTGASSVSILTLKTEYDEHMQIVTVESCIKGGGTGLMSVVMDCLPEDMKVCV
jgi:hypothetical protein